MEGGSYIPAMCVINLSHSRVIWRCINAHIVKSVHLFLKRVISHSQRRVIYRYIKVHEVECVHLPVMYVISHSCSRIMWRYIKAHSGKCAFFSDTCNKSFPEQGNPKVHQHTCSGGRPFTSSMCNKSFMWQIALKVLQCTHTGERSLLAMCVINNSFTEQGYLKVHQHTHTHIYISAMNVRPKYFFIFSIVTATQLWYMEHTVKGLHLRLDLRWG
jgi:hypothetical protein